ncbi:hypothetical protein WJX81_003302 [Elliptochloris bilobata]|uniref:Uncharacterized protein n=1 Tax=Elliptochloris bilobata TaxID=381761 RepID=A0AAW1RNA1_9CHLO
MVRKLHWQPASCPQTPPVPRRQEGAGRLLPASLRFGGQIIRNGYYTSLLGKGRQDAAQFAAWSGGFPSTSPEAGHLVAHDSGCINLGHTGWLVQLALWR